MSLRSMQSRTWGSCNLKARAEGISGPHEFALQAQQDNKTTRIRKRGEDLISHAKVPCLREVFMSYHVMPRVPEPLSER